MPVIAATPYRVLESVSISGTGNESVQKIIINSTINLCFFENPVSILVISNHNSFQLLFDKIASVVFV